MDHIDYFKLQAKNLFKDYKTKKPVFDKIIGDFLYHYNPKHFDIDAIIFDYNIDEEKFSLMKAQHLFSNLLGFKKWAELLKASANELELARLLWDNQHKIHVEDWKIYIARVEFDHKMIYDAKSKLEIFKNVFVNVDGHHSQFGDYRLNKVI